MELKMCILMQLNTLNVFMKLNNSNYQLQFQKTVLHKLYNVAFWVR